MESERIFTTVAGIGSGLASRIHKDLGIESLADLHAAAYDGRLASLPNFGRKRLQINSRIPCMPLWSSLWSR